MGHYADGRASLVVGTHTHIPTADLRILPVEQPIRQMLVCAAIMIVSLAWKNSCNGSVPWGGNTRLSVALGPVTLAGVIVETDNVGLALLFTLCAVAGFWPQPDCRPQLCGNWDQLAGQTIMKNRCQDWFRGFHLL